MTPVFIQGNKLFRNSCEPIAHAIPVVVVPYQPLPSLSQLLPFRCTQRKYNLYHLEQVPGITCSEELPKLRIAQDFRIRGYVAGNDRGAESKRFQKDNGESFVKRRQHKCGRTLHQAQRLSMGKLAQKLHGLSSRAFEVVRVLVIVISSTDNHERWNPAKG